MGPVTVTAWMGVGVDRGEGELIAEELELNTVCVCACMRVCACMKERMDTHVNVSESDCDRWHCSPLVGAEAPGSAMATGRAT